jgi:hypothetical protein
MARRTNPGNAEMLSEEDLNKLRAVRDFYERSYRDCRRFYNQLPTRKQMQTLVQVWKQLWKWRGP